MLGITVISLCLLLALAFAIGQIVHLRRRLSEEAVDLSAIEALSTVWSWEQDSDFRFVRFRGGGGVREAVGLDSLIGGTRWGTEHVVLDPAAMGRGFVAYLTVGLSDHSKEGQARFERAVARLDEVRECHNITGTIEYLLRVETADLAAYKAFHTDRIGTIEGVRQLTTHVVMDSPKDERG